MSNTLIYRIAQGIMFAIVISILLSIYDENYAVRFVA